MRHPFLKPESLFLYIKLLFFSFSLVFRKMIDIVHCDKVMPTGLIGYLLRKILGKPYIVYAHGEEVQIYRRYKFKKRIMPIIYNSSDKVIANSSFTKSLLINLGVKEEKIAIVNPGVDIKTFNPHIECSEIIRKHNLNGKIVLLTISRIEERKGHELVVRTLAKLIKDFPDLVYLIVGKGEGELKLRQLVKSLNLDNFVKFVGYVGDEDLPKYYCACDLFIMPNKEMSSGSVEGFGITFIEAGACAKPVIGGRSGGTVDSIIDGQTGLLIEKDDEEGLYALLRKLLVDKDYMRTLGQNGRRRAVEELNWDLVAQKIHHISSIN